MQHSSRSFGRRTSIDLPTRIVCNSLRLTGAGSGPSWRIQSKPCKSHHQDLRRSNDVVLDADHGASNYSVSGILSVSGSESLGSPGRMVFGEMFSPYSIFFSQFVSLLLLALTNGPLHSA